MEHAGPCSDSDWGRRGDAKLASSPQDLYLEKGTIVEHARRCPNKEELILLPGNGQRPPL